MPDEHDLRRPFKKSILFLMALVALSAIAMVITKTISEWESIRSRRLNQAVTAAKLWQAFEARRASMPQNVVKDWASKLVQHYHVLEVKYREGASKPWQPLPPDPPEPDMPTFSELWKSATERRQDEEI